MKWFIKHIFAFATILLMISCGNNQSREQQKKLDTTSQVIPIHGVDLAIFDGISFKGWHAYNKPAENIKNWTIIDSALVCLGSAADAHGGDIVTDTEYENFELSWEWKVNKGSNSGVMYHVVEDSVYLAPYETGPEYQIIDDIGFPQKLEDWQKTAADYAMFPPKSNKKLRPIGEWNSSKIVYNNGHVEHWLNGEKVVEFERDSEEWKKKRTSGKWKDFPGYASAKKGKIALQDHGQKAYFRKIYITEL
jgi:hypothetical protein